ncbi:kinesin family member 25 [Sarotherodon galilaeus]
MSLVVFFGLVLVAGDRPPLLAAARLTLHSTLRYLLRVVGLQEDGPMSLFRAVPGRAPWTKARKEPAEVVQASDKDASWAPPG